MAEESTRLDGNAAAGILTEVFGREMTTVACVCAGCGDTRAIGALVLYGHEMGTILRCPGCETAMLRVAKTRTRLWLDMRGVSILRIDQSQEESARRVVGE